MDEVGVTVFCLVYNHEKYLKQCLDSLTHQSTSFRYSVIVHDDASTDRSAEIIKEYAIKYPDIIVPIYQRENQYQKHTGIVKTFIEPLVCGKYVAICEGDDYWTSTDKLQKQYDIMENHPECGICLHRTVEANENGEVNGIEYPWCVYETGMISPAQLFATLSPRMYHTSSFFMRASLWHEYIQNPPAYKTVSTVGDVPMILYFGSRYGIYQLNEVMSAYRRGVPTGWSTNRHQANEKVLFKHHDSVVNTFLLFDRETDGQYHSICVERISKNMFSRNAVSNGLKRFLKRENKEYLAFLPIKKRFMVFAGILFPRLIKKLYLHLVKKGVENRNARWLK